MKSLAVAAAAVVVFLVLVRYCISGRRLSTRPGALYLVILGIACASVVVSGVAVFTLDDARDRRNTVFAGTGPLVPPLQADPSGALLVERQSVRYPRPTGSDPVALRAWQQRLRSVLAIDVYGLSSATRATPEVTEVAAVDDDELIRRELTIAAGDGDSVVAVLLMPRAESGPLPGILVVPGHAKPGRSGLAQMVLPVRSYHHAGARELARAGFATLTLELRGFGLRGPPRFPEHRVVAFNALLAGRSYKQLAFDDISRALDVFAAMPEVNAARLGIAGVSLGAEIAVEYAALEPRLKAIAFHSHGGPVGPYPARTSPRSTPPHYCHIIPGANTLMVREDPFLLLAPRPTQGLRGAREPFGDPRFGETLLSVWSAFGAAERLELDNVPGAGHEFFPDHAVRFFSEHL